MNENFDRCFAFLMKWEGGYINDSDDPGGETNFGISKRSHPSLDIAQLTEASAKELYRQEYWTTSNCQSRPWPWDLIMFDTAVNLGVHSAAILFQENQDWRDFLLSRVKYYVSIAARTHNKYLKGWMNRIVDLHAEARKK